MVQVWEGLQELWMWQRPVPRHACDCTQSLIKNLLVWTGTEWDAALHGQARQWCPCLHYHSSSPVSSPWSSSSWLHLWCWCTACSRKTLEACNFRMWAGIIWLAMWVAVQMQLKLQQQHEEYHRLMCAARRWKPTRRSIRARWWLSWQGISRHPSLHSHWNAQATWRAAVQHSGLEGLSSARWRNLLQNPNFFEIRRYFFILAILQLEISFENLQTYGEILASQLWIDPEVLRGLCSR